MRYFDSLSFDEAKSERNSQERGLPFELAAEMDMAAAVVREDRRRDYGEPRFRALGYIGPRLHVLVFTTRGRYLHVISFRKANAREQKAHHPPAARPRDGRRREP